MPNTNVLQFIRDRASAAVTLTRGEVRNGKTLQSIFERSAAAVTLMPSVGQGTDTTTVRLQGETMCEVEEGSWQVTAAADPKLGGSDGHPDPGFFLRAAIGICFVQTAAFKTAGFEGVTSERFSIALPFPSAEAACEAIFRGGPVALTWRNLDEETRVEARDEYLHSIASHRNGEGYAIPGEFVVANGVKRQ